MKQPSPETANFLHTLSVLKQNKIPMSVRGRPLQKIDFIVNCKDSVDDVLDALESNTVYKGSISIKAPEFTDVHGLSIANIIKKNTLTELYIENIKNPFSDRVCVNIGEALSMNTTLKTLSMYLNVGTIAPINLMKFLNNPNSNLCSIGYLKITKKLFEAFTEYLNKESKLKEINFYYDPLEEVNLLYEKEIPDDVKDAFAFRIENESNVTNVNIIPRNKEYQVDINEKLTNDIDVILKTLQFSCEIVKKEQESEIDIEKVFTEQNEVIDSIIEKIDRPDGKELKHSIVSVRSYLDRAIGESLNQALYDLDVQRERCPDKKELFTPEGSLSFVAKDLNK